MDCWTIAALLMIIQFGLWHRAMAFSSRSNSRGLAARATGLLRTFATDTASARKGGVQTAIVDTIYALSSGSGGRTGVSVVRVSGPRAMHCLEALSSPTKPFRPPQPRIATLRSLHCPETRDLLDKALLLWFPSPHSFTGDDVVEMHVHGSKAVLSGLFHALSWIGSQNSGGAIRPAEPGEFTKRAFENGKMDLTEVEGLADLLAADTAQQRKQALRQMEGHLRKAFERWRDVLKKSLAHTEAVIDFGDDDREGDIDDSAFAALIPSIRQLRSELERHLRDNRKGEIIRDGVQIALCGPPNAGKSSLMNYLARRPAAIVSPIAGTTRDIVEIRLDIAGYPCIVRDTAGLRATCSDVIELEGMKRAREAFHSAHIKLLVIDASDQRSIEDSLRSLRDLALPMDLESASSLSPQEAERDDEAASLHIQPFRCMCVLNKADLLAGEQRDSAWNAVQPSLPDEWRQRVEHFTVSCTTGEGMDALEQGLHHSLLGMFHAHDGQDVGQCDGGPEEESVLITRERHRLHVERCVGHLDRFLTLALPMDAAAEELRLAMVELGRVTGRVDVEELLDIIFRDFCIGK